MLHIVLHLLLQRALQLVRRGQQILDAAELLDELLCRLLAHSRTARDVVHRIAHQSEHVDDLQGRLQSPLPLHFLHSEYLCLVASAHGRTVDAHAVGDELTVVLVGCHHVGLYAQLVSLTRQGADDVVGLVALHLEHRNAVGRQDVLDDGHGEADGFGRLLALSLVEGVGLVAEGRAVGVEGHADVGGMLLRQHLVQRVHEA